MKKLAYFDAIDFAALLDDLVADDFDISPSSSSTDEMCDRLSDSGADLIRNGKYSKCKISLKRKVVTSDIRRMYAGMLVNVLNSADFPLTFGFLDTYFTPDFTEYAINYNPVTNEPFYDKFQGSTAVGKMFCTMYQMAPDLSFRISDTKIITSPDTDKCKIVANFVVLATKVLDVSDSLAFEPENANVDQENTNGSPSITNCSGKRKNGMDKSIDSKRAVIEKIQKSVNSITSTMPLSVDPIQIRLESQLTMYVNEDKLISMIVLDGSAQMRKATMDAHCPFCNARKLFKYYDSFTTAPYTEGKKIH